MAEAFSPAVGGVENSCLIGFHFPRKVSSGLFPQVHKNIKLLIYSGRQAMGRANVTGQCRQEEEGGREYANYEPRQMTREE